MKNIYIHFQKNENKGSVLIKDNCIVQYFIILIRDISYSEHLVYH